VLHLPSLPVLTVPPGCLNRFTSMLSRTLLIFASATLGASNPVASAPLDISELGRVIGSYAHSLMDTLESSIGKNSTRPKRLERETVPYGGNESPGTIVVRTNERRLYFVLADKKAIRYPVGVGRIGKQWQGRAEIDGAYVQPAWSPTAEMKRESPTLPSLIPGGAPNNPMGARALTLSGGKYAIHGTNRPESVGRDASYGCLRMFNDHIIDLYGRVSVGTKVIVTRGS
jgi:lipoprotein-anchoring transpeptidase ErfK/SrfK